MDMATAKRIGRPAKVEDGMKTSIKWPTEWMARLDERVRARRLANWTRTDEIRQLVAEGLGVVTPDTPESGVHLAGSGRR